MDIKKGKKNKQQCCVQTRTIIIIIITYFLHKKLNKNVSRRISPSLSLLVVHAEMNLSCPFSFIPPPFFFPSSSSSLTVVVLVGSGLGRLPWLVTKAGEVAQGDGGGCCVKADRSKRAKSE